MGGNCAKQKKKKALQTEIQNFNRDRRHQQRDPVRRPESEFENRLSRQDESSTWGRTTYNLLDIESGIVPQSLPPSPKKSHRTRSPAGATTFSSSFSGSYDHLGRRSDSPPVNVVDGITYDLHKFDDFPTGKDKYSNFRNITEARDKPPPPPKAKRPPPVVVKTQPKKKSPVQRSPSPTKVGPARMTVLNGRRGSDTQSDVSTLHLGDQASPKGQPFRTLNNNKKTFSKNVPKNPPNNQRRPESEPRQPYQRRPTDPEPIRRESRSRSPPKRQESRKPDPPAKRPPMKHSKSLTSAEHQFTDLNKVKSATNSVVSSMSNYEQRTKVEKFDDKKTTLDNVGLSRINALNNQFKDQRVLGRETYEKAVKSLQKEEWQDKIQGIELIVSVARKSPEVLKNDIKNVIVLMLEELKNLRSQVCRSAAQAFAEMYLLLGRSMETNLDKVVVVLLQKAADTNKFIRQDCNIALDVMSENLPVLRVMESVVAGGANQKNVVIRSTVARIMDAIVTRIGVERFVGSSPEFQELVIRTGAKNLTDGAQEVRAHTKHMFAELVQHQRFEGILNTYLQEHERRDIQKALDSLNK